MTDRHTAPDTSAGEKAWRDIVDDMFAVHPPAEPLHDPYGPDSDDYATRTREQVIELPGGLVRVDYGAAV
ncbi:hypothetical protein E5675_19005 [Sphingopyxis sp. PAMC25046]|uniref:hypothetical protein n=1 Tax=Sphingopyxis sp. PAMC25046 TaxID=2565556 RepID=UPI00109DAFB2|nr:hypothetical protein [Sphingopyxis sp. PAMC25046]QCB56312.1 hypothetical protein E5675_19005 [Sphingopyxis sp. PAMC25046]